MPTLAPLLNPFNDNGPIESEPQVIAQTMLQSTSPAPSAIEAVQSNSGETQDLLGFYKRLVLGDNLMAERDDIREEIKDKVALAEAHTAERITALNGTVQLILQKLENLNGRFTEIREDGNARASEIRADVTARISDFRNDMKEDGRSTRNTVIIMALTSAIGLAAILVAIVLAVPSFIDLGMKLETKHAQEAPQAPATKTP